MSASHTNGLPSPHNVGSDGVPCSAAPERFAGGRRFRQLGQSRLSDEFDLEAVGVGEVPRVDITAAGVRMPIGKEQLPPVLECIRDDLVTLGDRTGVKSQVIQARLHPIMRRSSHRG